MIDIIKSKMNKFDYEQWTSYFIANNAKRLKIDFLHEPGLTDAEKKLIFPSIRAFQKGEGSDGKYLMKTVDEFVQKGGKAECRKAMEWFIKEENWHSAYLKKYMDFYSVKALKESFLDFVFRKLRKSGGLKCEVTILVTAEMIALSYYDALSKCTSSPALKSICEQMLNDELPHIMFQSYTLGCFKLQRADKISRILIMKITSVFVWIAFHNVLKSGGFNFNRFINENMNYLHQSIYLSENNR